MRKIIETNNTETAANTNMVDEMTKKQLVAEYNVLAQRTGHSPVKAFASRAKGIERVNSLMDLVADLDEVEGIIEKSTPEVAPAKSTNQIKQTIAAKTGTLVEVLTTTQKGTKLVEKKMYRCGDLNVIAHKKQWCIIEFNADAKMVPGKVLEAYDGRPKVVAA